MLSNLKVFSVYMKKWILIFSLAQMVLLAFMIGSLATKNWVETDFKVFLAYSVDYDSDWINFSFPKFEGSIAVCNKGYKADSDETSISYGQLETDICDLKDKIDNDYSGEYYYLLKDINDYKSICKMFQSLNGGAVIKIIFDIACMIALFVWFIGMMCMLRSVNCYWMTYICSVCTICFFYTGSILWFAVTGATFGSCSKKPKNGDQPNICATHGPSLMIFIMIILPLTTILYIIIACKARKQQFKANLSSSQNNQNVSPSVQMQNFQIHQPVNYNPGGYNLSGYPPGGYPAGVYQTGVYATGAYPTGAYPAGAIPSGAYPAGVNQTGAYPAGANPAGAYPVGANPTSSYPTGAYPQGAYPPGSQSYLPYQPAYYQANNPNPYQINEIPPAVIAGKPYDVEVKETNK